MGLFNVLFKLSVLAMYSPALSQEMSEPGAVYYIICQCGYRRSIMTCYDILGNETKQVVKDTITSMDPQTTECADLDGITPENFLTEICTYDMSDAIGCIANIIENADANRKNAGEEEQDRIKAADQCLVDRVRFVQKNPDICKDKN